MKTTLVILAAGIGSRYGGGIKQIEPVGPNGEIIIDYSIHDAVKAGFNKIVFIIRHDIYDDFYEVIGKRLEEKFAGKGIELCYAYQEKSDFLPERTKPWGTGQAVLSCKGIVNEPFAVINADDYYGCGSFQKAYDYLQTAGDPKVYGMVGYVLKNTLSDNGGVTRGICSVENGVLTGIDETKNIVKTADGGAASGEKAIPVDALVSMNFWMYPAEFIDVLEKGFPEFQKNMKDPMKDEYLLPTIADELLKEGSISINVVPTDDTWFGVTYKEDKPAVVEEFKKLYAKNVYSPDLYSDVF